MLLLPFAVSVRDDRLMVAPQDGGVVKAQPAVPGRHLGLLRILQGYVCVCVVCEQGELIMTWPLGVQNRPNTVSNAF
jgi:hypothetical protein